MLFSLANLKLLVDYFLFKFLFLMGATSLFSLANLDFAFFFFIITTTIDVAMIIETKIAQPTAIPVISKVDNYSSFLGSLLVLLVSLVILSVVLLLFSELELPMTH